MLGRGNDQYFLDRLTTLRWHIATQEESPCRDMRLHLLEQSEALPDATAIRQQQV